jgi:N-acetylmuramoyl-L-alanine amidase
MKKIFFLFCSLSFLYLNCGPAVYYVKPPDWENESHRDSTINYYSQFIKGWKFFIDPGHGGDDRKNKGPKGEAVEADLNLRVALGLRTYLEKAGAKVILTRDKDSSIPLIERSKLSNESGSDIFISIHHNALGNDDHTTNYTSTWYHAFEGHKDYNPCNHDIAKYVQRDLAYVMGNNGSLGSFDGTLSDYTVFPNSGFSVLRNAKIPAILIEGSFFSSNYEEQRLIIPEFNSIEAWGVFRGIGKYLKSGVPKLEMLTQDRFEISNPSIKIKASDKFGIDPKSITVILDEKEIPFDFDKDSCIISIEAKDRLYNGIHLLNVSVANKNGNHSFPFIKNIKIAPKASTLKIQIFPKSIPPDPKAISVVTVKAMDEQNNPIADSALINFKISSGKIETSVYSLNGLGSVYITAPEKEMMGIVEASCDGITVFDTITFAKSENKYITGRIIDNERKALPDCGIILPRLEESSFLLPNYTMTDKNGIYIIPQVSSDSLKLVFLKDGYFGKEISLGPLKNVTVMNTTLYKVCAGILFGKNIVLDPRYGGTEKGEVFNNLTSSRLNLEIALYLQKLLKAAGANVLLVREEDKYISEEDRAGMTKDLKRGYYVRIDVSNNEKISMVQYPNIPNTNLSKSILSGLHKLTGLDTTKITSTYGSIFMLTSIGTVSVSLPSLNSKYFSSENLKYREMECAWGIFNGILNFYGFDSVESKTIKKIVTENGKPAVGIEALLDGAIISVSDNNGYITFYNITDGSGKVILLTEDEKRFIIK